jgi:hypothetical protein
MRGSEIAGPIGIWPPWRDEQTIEKRRLITVIAQAIDK